MRKKLKGGSTGVFFRKKSQNPENGDPLVLPGIVCYAEKRKILFGSVP